MARLINHLIECGVAPNIARKLDEPLSACMALSAIDSVARKAGFLANAFVETQGFTKLEENLWYTTPERIMEVFKKVTSIELAEKFVRNPKGLASFVYADRLGNGNEATGDGWTYRGRGIFQLTGKFNYQRASIGTEMGSVYLHNPDIVAEYDDACITATWYWTDCKCNYMMDARKFIDTIRAINGPAMLHTKERRAKFAQFTKVMS
jgi:putative chitinase